MRSCKAFLEIITAALAHFAIGITVVGGLIAHAIQLPVGFFVPQPKMLYQGSENISVRSSQQLTLACMALGVTGLFAQAAVGTPLLDQAVLTRAFHLVKELQTLQVPRASVFVYPESHPVVAISMTLLRLSSHALIFEISYFDRCFRLLETHSK
jgi:hypothetical protein